jgi:predicted nucleic acid-binding Zn ribbon protein
MQCPFCASELKPDTVVCEQCGAIKMRQRTTLGVFVGWAGMVTGLVLLMWWVPLLFLPLVGFNLGGYPWMTLIVGTILAAGLIWYSRSTVHSRWIRRED